MYRYMLGGLFIFLSLSIALAPAGMISHFISGLFVSGQGDAKLLNLRGTVWQGQGDIVVHGKSLGELRWSVQPLALLGANLVADWQLDQTLSTLHGQVRLGDDLTIDAQGQVLAAAVNEWLDQYDIYLEGDFSVHQFSALVATDERTLKQLDGEIRWSGGLVRYTLSGLLHEQHLPPLHTNFHTSFHTNTDSAHGLHGVVTAVGDNTPLMIISSGVPGFIKIGITKGFTRMLRQPWPGSDPEHTVVLEVEEQLF